MTNQQLWAITAYFNPCGYRRRLENYRIFHDNLHVPLVTVELSFNSNFDLHDTDADILVQLHAKDIMWQKERLLNIALQHLPQTCSKVTWVDCDILFPDKNWVGNAIAMLKDYQMVQLYKKVHHLPADFTINDNHTEELIQKKDSILTEYSFAYIQHLGSAVPANLQIRDKSFSDIQTVGSPGVCWAARKEVLLEHGFYDACIAGGGDKAIAFAALGKMRELPINRLMNEHQLKHYLEWALPFSSCINKNISFIENDVYHLWHGSFENRYYRDRHEHLAKLSFNPNKDIKKDSNGVWQWTNGKTTLHDYLKTYFSARLEDECSI